MFYVNTTPGAAAVVSAEVSFPTLSDAASGVPAGALQAASVDSKSAVSRKRQISLRIGFYLREILAERAASSVTAYAVPPSPHGKALLPSPSGRVSAEWLTGEAAPCLFLLYMLYNISQHFWTFVYTKLSQIL